MDKVQKETKKKYTSCQVYRSGCKFYENVMGCTSSCQCANCENPYGKRISDVASIACSSRKRRHHERTTERLAGNDCRWDANSSLDSVWRTCVNGGDAVPLIKGKTQPRISL